RPDWARVPAPTAFGATFPPKCPRGQEGRRLQTRRPSFVWQTQQAGIKLIGATCGIAHCIPTLAHRSLTVGLLFGTKARARTQPRRCFRGFTPPKSVCAITGNFCVPPYNQSGV